MTLTQEQKEILVQALACCAQDCEQIAASAKPRGPGITAVTVAAFRNSAAQYRQLADIIGGADEVSVR